MDTSTQRRSSIPWYHINGVIVHAMPDGLFYLALPGGSLYPEDFCTEAELIPRLRSLCTPVTNPDYLFLLEKKHSRREKAKLTLEELGDLDL